MYLVVGYLFSFKLNMFLLTNPSMIQVFALLEKIYHSFDELARTRRVFKVETVGDCYVAAAGLPEIINDHAVVVARFARDCLDQFPKLVREMEVVLGPDTCELGKQEAVVVSLVE